MKGRINNKKNHKCKEDYITIPQELKQGKKVKLATEKGNELWKYNPADNITKRTNVCRRKIIQW